MGKEATGMSPVATHLVTLGQRKPSQVCWGSEWEDKFRPKPNHLKASRCAAAANESADRAHGLRDQDDKDSTLNL